MLQNNAQEDRGQSFLDKYDSGNLVFWVPSASRPQTYKSLVSYTMCFLGLPQFSEPNLKQMQCFLKNEAGWRVDID